MNKRDTWLAMTDRELLALCHEDFYRASGPGGQKRNKIESAVRLRHPESGIIVTATESRQRQENRDRALRRLREAIAYRVRMPLPEFETGFEKIVENGEIRVGRKHPAFLWVAAVALDAIDSQVGKVSRAAECLGARTAQLVKFLSTTDDLWEAAQRLRAAHGLAVLKR